MVVKESDGSVVMSFKVPGDLNSKERKLLVYSKQFVSEIRRINGMAEHVSYDVPGSYSEKHHIVLFQFSDSKPTD